MGKIMLLLVIGVGFYFAFVRPKSDKGGISGAIAEAITPKAPEAPAKPPVSFTPPVAPAANLEVRPGAPSVTANPPAVHPVPMGPGVVQRLSPGVEVDEVLPSWGNYTFSYREVPPIAFVQDWQKLGLDAVCDPVSRSVAYRGPQAAVDGFRAALVAMDKVPGSCCVQGWVVYVDATAQKGFDFVAALGAVVGDDTLTGVLTPNGLTLNVGVDRLSGALRAICSDSTVQVVQNPYVRLTDGVEAKVEATQEYPLMESVVSSNGLAQSSIRYRKVGLQMTVKPVFLSDRRLRMGVSQVNGLIGSTIKVGNNDVPVIQSQAVETTAELSVGQTLVLGGVRTLRKVEDKGIFSTSERVTEGTLYVILATYDDEPRAVEVDDPELIAPEMLDVPPPLTDAGVLPEKGWQGEERAFLNERGRK